MRSIICATKDGKIIVSESQKQILKEEYLKHKEVVITVDKPKRKATGKAKRYYWGVVVGDIVTETGNDKEMVHEFLKRKFVDPLIAYMGEEEIKVWTTKHLSTAEQEEFHEKCRLWAAEFLKITIPLPNEVAV